MNPYAVHFAATALLNNFTEYFNSYSVAERKNIRKRDNPQWTTNLDRIGRPPSNHTPSRMVGGP